MRKNKKIVIISLLLVVVLGMGVGYSILSKQLKIEGSATINETFDVAITDITSEVDYVSTNYMYDVGNHQSNAINIEEPSYTSDTATFNVKMGYGDTIDYIVTITNNGTIPAYISDINVEKTGTNAIIIDTPIGLTLKTLEPGQSFKYILKLSVDEEQEITEFTSNIVVTFDFVQATHEYDILSTNQSDYIVFGSLASNNSIEIMISSKGTVDAARDLVACINGDTEENCTIVETRNDINQMGGTIFYYDYSQLKSGDVVTFQIQQNIVNETGDSDYYVFASNIITFNR